MTVSSVQSAVGSMAIGSQRLTERTFVFICLLLAVLLPAVSDAQQTGKRRIEEAQIIILAALEILDKQVGKGYRGGRAVDQYRNPPLQQLAYDNVRPLGISGRSEERPFFVADHLGNIIGVQESVEIDFIKPAIRLLKDLLIGNAVDI
jgi:hypothetical protein